MKKILLFAALSMGALAVSANDYYDLTFNGEPVQNGDVIKVEIATETLETPIGTFYMRSAGADFNLVNKKATPVMTKVVAEGANPSTAEIKKDVAKYGTLSFCYANGGATGTQDNCLPSTDDNTLYSSEAVLPGSELKAFEWQCHASQIGENTTYSVTIDFYVSDSETSTNFIADSKTSITVEYVLPGNGNDAVNSINAEENAPVYYDLRGYKVASPEAGLYIVRRGNKVSKEFIR